MTDTPPAPKIFPDGQDDSPIPDPADRPGLAPGVLMFPRGSCWLRRRA